MRWTSIVGLAGLAVLFSGFGQTNTPVVSVEVEQALLSEDWQKLIALLSAAKDEGLPVVARLVKAHANLAVNNNNSSFCLFMSVAKPDDLKAWIDWTEQLASRHVDAPIAHYLLGDAFARLERWDSAVAAFDRALALRPDHPLVLNARGTVMAAQGRWDDALVDLTRASTAGETLADAHANLGAMWIQRRAGAEGAIRSFDRALELSSDFVLALNGKGCAQFVLGKWEEASDNIVRAGKVPACQTRAITMIDHNLTVLAVAAKRAQFPFFSVKDFINWQPIKEMLASRKVFLSRYFRNILLGGQPTDAVVDQFNSLLELPSLYDDNAEPIGRTLGRSFQNAKQGEQLLALLAETDPYRSRPFQSLTPEQQSRIRKLNRLLLESIFPDALLQIASANFDAPGFSIERNIGLVNSFSFKSTLPSSALQEGLFRMQYTWRPLADAAAAIPIFGSAISKIWNHHLDNQIGINTNILGARGVYSTPAGGVEFGLRQAYVDRGNWQVGTWFGLAYYVPPRDAEAGGRQVEGKR